MSLLTRFTSGALLLCALLASASCQADASGTLIKAAELKSQPFIDATAVANLPDNAALTVIGTQGAWSQVKTADGKSGWVRLLNVKLVKPEEARSAGQTLASIGGVVRTGTTKNTATTGVKGLSKEDIANAKPNPAEVSKLDSYKVKAAEVDRFAATHKLVAQNVPELNP